MKSNENALTIRSFGSSEEEDLQYLLIHGDEAAVIDAGKALEDIRKTLDEEGGELKSPIIEFYYKDDALHDPMINEDHIRVFGFAKDDEMAFIKETSHKVNQILKRFFDKLGIILVDYKLEYGRAPFGPIYLADEITPDGCRLWDKKTLKKLDKDRFRRDLGEIEEAYQEVFKRVCQEANLE